MSRNKSYSLMKLLAVFFLSMSMFIYEILITRLFSTILSYHFVFLATSLAILGIGFGGLLVYKAKKEYKYDNLTFILSLAYIGSILLIYKIPYLRIFSLYSIISSIPFIIGGMVLAIAFTKSAEISSKLYFADLLGSTLGSISIIPLMDNLGFMMTLFIVGFLCIISTVLFSFMSGSKKIRNSSFVIGFGILALLIQKNELIELEKRFTAYLTSPTTVMEYLKQNGDQNIKLLYTKWDSISRTDVIEESNNDKTIITDGGASAPMIKFNGDISKVQHLKKEINYLPFSIGNNDNSLLIGSGGGKDVLFALLGGSTNIDAVEINPSTIAAVNEFKDYNGDIYNYKGVNLHIDDGRNFIEKSKKKYNNIYLAMVMTNSVSNGGLSLSENYIYTKDAFISYFNKLDKNGYLSLMFHGPHDSLRGINTAIEALLDIGVKREEITNHFVAINSMTNDMEQSHKEMISMPVIVFKKEPFTTEEIQRIHKEAKNQNRVIMNMPGITYMELYHLYSMRAIELEDIYEKTPLNIAPTTDDKPFFFDYSKGIPTVLFFLFAVMIAVSLILYRLLKYKQVLRKGLYFGMIGIGFMMIEIPLIQRSILFLGNPAKSFSYILFALLLSSGIGSYFTNNKAFKVHIKGRQAIFLLIPLFIIILQIAWPIVAENYRLINDISKLIIVAALIFPLGFFMGMAFPRKIAEMKEGEENQFIPLMWGVNGIMSVTGSVLSLVMSMTLGFSLTIVIGALIYLSIFTFKL